MILNPQELERSLRLFRGRVKPFFGQLMSLPLATFAGLRISEIDHEQCVVYLPGGWRTQNPFRSTYWAAQGMAAEMASGAIPYAYVRAAPVPIRMILAGTSARFVKMCKTASVFTCDVGDHVHSAMETTMKTGKSVDCHLICQGRDLDGDIISEWKFDWSFRARIGSADLG